MKRTSALFFFAALVVALVSITGIRCYADGEDPTPIVIGDLGPNGLPIYHAPAQVPIQAAYSSSHSTIFVNFLYDLGYVSVEIENLTTGEYSQTTVNATQGVHPFVVSGQTGIYEIVFTLSGGQVYQGSFEIE